MISAIVPMHNLNDRTRDLCADLVAVADEVIVVDNGSTPPPDFGNVIPYRERFVWNEALNIGARAASGDILLFLHNDIAPTPEFIQALAAGVDEMTMTSADSRLDGCIAPHAFGLSRILYDAIGGFDESYKWFGWEMPDLAMAVIAAGGKVEYVGECEHVGALTVRTVMSTCTAKRVSCRDAAVFSAKWDLQRYPVYEEEAGRVLHDEFNDIKVRYWQKAADKQREKHGKHQTFNIEGGNERSE